MSIHVIDILQPLGKFPVAKSEHIDVNGVRLNEVLNMSSAELNKKIDADIVEANYAKKTDIPTKVSAFQNDAGYLIHHQDLSEYAKKTDIPEKTSQLQNDSGYVKTTDERLSNARPASDVKPWAKATNKPAYTKAEIGLSQVDNTSDADKPISNATMNALDSKATKFELNEFSEKVTNVETQQNVLSARMDTFEQLPEGSTTEDARLEDISVGYDGTQYNSPAEAVRSQFSDTNDSIRSADSVIEKIALTTFQNVWNPSTIAPNPYEANTHYFVLAKSSCGYVYGIRMKHNQEFYNYPIAVLTYNNGIYTVIDIIDCNVRSINGYVTILINKTYSGDVFFAFRRFMFNSMTGTGDTLGYVHKLPPASIVINNTIPKIDDKGKLYADIAIVGGEIKNATESEIKDTNENIDDVAEMMLKNIWNPSSIAPNYFVRDDQYFVLCTADANEYIYGIKLKHNELSYNYPIGVLEFDGTNYIVRDVINSNTDNPSKTINGYSIIPLKKAYPFKPYFAFKRFAFNSMTGTGDTLGYVHKVAAASIVVGATATTIADAGKLYADIKLFGARRDSTKLYGHEEQGAYSKWFKPSAMLISNPIIDTVKSDKPAYIGRWFNKVVNGANCMVTTTSGAQIVFWVKNATTVTVNFKAMTNTNAYYAYSIDGGAMTRKNIVQNTFDIPDTSEHTIRIVMDGITEQIGKWNGNGYAVSGIDSDGEVIGCKVTEPIIAFYGDSITEGIRALGITPTSDMGDTNSATGAYPYFVAKELNAIPYFCGYGASGATVNGSFKDFSTAIDYVMDGVSTPTFYPTLICVNHGENDKNADSGDFKTNYKECLEKLHRKYPKATIFCIAPYSGAKNTEVQDCANSYDFCKFIPTAGWNPETADGVHLTKSGASTVGHNIAEFIKSVIY